ncbi:hypothetical protein [uncultured Tolumonas sp.]|uniref:hypothetical protein n=1 Tax=uncultured Tolumonas sp. TaxID=263765 RepID=UPI002A0A918E|nr:hypothetical protein [uncultured Tolumonas sp.]
MKKLICFMLVVGVLMNYGCSSSSENQQKSTKSLIDDSITEDANDISKARELQNSGNPLNWIAGKFKEEWNMETMHDSLETRSIIQSSQRNEQQNRQQQDAIRSQLEQQKTDIIENIFIDQMFQGEKTSQEQINLLSEKSGFTPEKINEIYTNAQSKFLSKSTPKPMNQKICVKYENNYIWSKGYYVDAYLEKGNQINSKVSSLALEENSTYVVIFWNSENVSIIKITQDSISSLEQDGVDLRGIHWRISNSSLCI